MAAPQADVKDLHAALFRVVGSFRRQRGEFLAQRTSTRQADGPVAARHMGAAELLIERGPMTVGALASLLRVEITTASRLATELEEAGVVARRRDPTDGRRIFLEVVPSARARVEEFMARLRAPLARAAARLTPAERAGFLRGLSLYAEELDEETVASPPERSD